MTPPAATARARSTGHARTPTRRGLAPRGPRRVSGPARGARTAFPPAGAVALPTPLIHRLRQIPESRSLDRLLRSRGWIALLGVLLIGLVFMQVSLLKLNAGMGADVEKAAALERGNAMLQAEVSQLESNDRIQRLAIRAGMVLPTSNNVRYLGANGKRIGGAAAATNMPSTGEASTALLPTVPTDTATGTTATPGATDPTATTTPQTMSSVPDAALAQQQAAAASTTAAAQQQAPASTTQTTTPPATAATSTTAATGAAAPTGATAAPSDAATTAAAGGAATVGGATPGG
jgi:cell division protein FtsL